MLLLHAGIAEHDVVAAVSRRFTRAEITAALAFLQQQGLVNSSGVKRPLMLSKLFAEHMEVLPFWAVVLYRFSTKSMSCNEHARTIRDIQPGCHQQCCQEHRLSSSVL